MVRHVSTLDWCFFNKVAAVFYFGFCFPSNASRANAHLLAATAPSRMLTSSLLSWPSPSAGFRRRLPPHHYGASAIPSPIFLRCVLSYISLLTLTSSLLSSPPPPSGLRRHLPPLSTSPKKKKKKKINLCGEKVLLFNFSTFPLFSFVCGIV